MAYSVAISMLTIDSIVCHQHVTKILVKNMSPTSKMDVAKNVSAFRFRPVTLTHPFLGLLEDMLEQLYFS